MKKIRVSIAGASGYSGGELLRLLLFHPQVEISQVTSERFFGKFIHKLHPNLRKLTDLKFCSLDELEACDLLFLCLPHGQAMKNIDKYLGLSERIIDLSADFRLRSADIYEKWYHTAHLAPARLTDFIYGIPELHRDEMRTARWVSSAGCNATASILGLYPLYKFGLVQPGPTIIEVKVGSSEGGNSVSEASHHPVRSGCLRSFAPTAHRHTAEIEQELQLDGPVQISFSATSVDMVRGVLATAHAFLNERMEEKELWKIYRQAYGQEPFIRIVKERDGNYRYPEPKLLAGTNYCDIGFETDPFSTRVVVISAIDNLMKGAAGQAVQAMNLMHGFEETAALNFPGLHPV
jgi:N-acetyl-gamma-glutamyl-phosphate/LysW-gamma-L-alpha-aminoadipyl-6-phosphate reductase